MKLLSILMFIFVSITAFAGQFKYRDHVKVKSGFYEGCTGTVEFEWSSQKDVYTVNLERDRNGRAMDFSEHFRADNLEPIN